MAPHEEQVALMRGYGSELATVVPRMSSGVGTFSPASRSGSSGSCLSLLSSEDPLSQSLSECGDHDTGNG